MLAAGGIVTVVVGEGVVVSGNMGTVVLVSIIVVDCQQIERSQHKNKEYR